MLVVLHRHKHTIFVDTAADGTVGIVEDADAIVLPHVPHAVELVSIGEVVDAPIMQPALSPTTVVHVSTCEDLPPQPVPLAVPVFALIGRRARGIYDTDIAMGFSRLPLTFDLRTVTQRQAAEAMAHVPFPFPLVDITAKVVPASAVAHAEEELASEATIGAVPLDKLASLGVAMKKLQLLLKGLLTNDLLPRNHVVASFLEPRIEFTLHGPHCLAFAGLHYLPLVQWHEC
mmetsp:Transcript_60086/g.139979  ORF Transcript_60086/g.139979 Transcript_60086/m.139979 type:complete len:231 (-) Transcript_60086:217-909(-)